MLLHRLTAFILVIGRKEVASGDFIECGGLSQLRRILIIVREGAAIGLGVEKIAESGFQADIFSYSSFSMLPRRKDCRVGVT